jgi:geranylgeranyl diphosphate synthase type II
MSFPYLEILEEFFHQHFNSTEYSKPQIRVLLDSMLYSLKSGGKRFRPNLVFLLSEALNLDSNRVVPFAAAVECVHTYSLIHDDLPCMDNDYWRRNRPTNHIQFGESTALLAGDALLTEAFLILSHYYRPTPEIGLGLVKILAQAAGIWGMIGGQIMDIKAKNILADKDETILIHKLKTGALISSCSQGVACIASTPHSLKLKEFGELLGFAFQLKDDFLDFDPNKPEPCNLVTCLGESAAKKMLCDSSQQAELSLREINLLTDKLRSLISFNLDRHA